MIQRSFTSAFAPELDRISTCLMRLKQLGALRVLAEPMVIDLCELSRAWTPL